MKVWCISVDSVSQSEAKRHGYIMGLCPGSTIPVVVSTWYDASDLFYDDKYYFIYDRKTSGLFSKNCFITEQEKRDKILYNLGI